MNTEQNYVGKGDSTTSSEPSATPNPQAGQNMSETRNLEYNRNAVPDNPSRLNLCLSLDWTGRNDDGAGASEVSVVFDALKHYKERVSAWRDTPDRALTLGLIEDMEEDALDHLLRYASTMASLLHSLKFSQVVEKEVSNGK